MTDKVYKTAELVGRSTESSDDAVIKAINRALEEISTVDSFEVIGTRGNITGNSEPIHWEAIVKIRFYVG